jgi:mono/diheme cytochrome c family protein/glucose/arabinose dehydrogenase
MRKSKSLFRRVTLRTGGTQRGFLAPILLLLGNAILIACSDGPSPPKTPLEELSTFQINDGLRVELVASEPMVEDPVFITFDEDNRLWVVEMRGFMPDVDGNGEDQRVGRISILQDTTGDGLMDKSKVYIDSLIMPRALAVVKGGALLVEDQKLWFAPDANGDLKADSKNLIDSTYGGPPLPEHSPNGLFRGLDNWYYNAKSAVRYKLVGNKWIRDSTEFRGQWGISHDDKGRLFYNYNWSQLHADLVPPNYLSRNPHHRATSGIDHGVTLDRRVYPIRPNPAVNRGYIPGTLDKEGRLLEFTAACSPFIYRAHTLPNDYYGNAFVAEPSGNLVKRNVVVEDSGRLSAYDPHPGREFMASTDERFRPVSITSGPDGALYIVDMYRGLVQHEKYVTAYLREQTLKRKLEQPVHYGRIWRVVPEDFKQPDPKDPSLQETTRLSGLGMEELVALLASENGWIRDMAQRLLVERQDERSFFALQNAALYSSSSLQRVHALWTLDALGQSDPKTLMTLQLHVDEFVSNTALRLLEPHFIKDKAVRDLVRTEVDEFGKNNTYGRHIQIALSAYAINRVDRYRILYKILTLHPDSALVRDAVMSSLKDEEYDFLRMLVKGKEWQTASQGKEIAIEGLAAAVMRKRSVAEIEQTLGLAAGNSWFANSIASGLTTAGPTSQPLKLKAQPALIKKKSLDSVLTQKISLAFEWPGHKVDASSVRINLNERDQQRFVEGRQLYLTSCASCHGTNGAGMNRLAPTLVGSEWVLGDERRLALLVLHGLEGPIEVAGRRYDIPEILPVMPSHSTLDDGAITSILIYIRNEWGNNAGPVSGRTVGQTRHLTQGRVVPWSVEELNKHIADSVVIED